MTGIVYKSTGSWYSVKAEDNFFYECRIKGKFRIKGIKSTNPIAVGDKVSFEIETKNDVETGVINENRNAFPAGPSGHCPGLSGVCPGGPGRPRWCRADHAGGDDGGDDCPCHACAAAVAVFVFLASSACAPQNRRPTVTVQPRATRS